MTRFELGQTVVLRSSSSYADLKENDTGTIVGVSPRGWLKVAFDRDGGEYTIYEHEVVSEDIYQLVIDLGLDPEKSANEDFNESWRL